MIVISMFLNGWPILACILSFVYIHFVDKHNAVMVV